MRRMPSFVTAALLFGALWGTLVASDSVVDGSGRPDLRLLFVGNSLLYYNGGVYKVQLFPLVMHAFEKHTESAAPNPCGMLVRHAERYTRLHFCRNQ